MIGWEFCLSSEGILLVMQCGLDLLSSDAGAQTQACPRNLDNRPGTGLRICTKQLWRSKSWLYVGVLDPVEDTNRSQEGMKWSAISTVSRLEDIGELRRARTSKDVPESIIVRAFYEDVFNCEGNLITVVTVGSGCPTHEKFRSKAGVSQTESGQLNGPWSRMTVGILSSYGR